MEAFVEGMRLTKREVDVLRLISRGCTYAQAAAVMQAVRLGLIL